MKQSPVMSGSQLAFEILDYLIHHPGAKDTLEGIVEWWLLEQQIRRESARVQEVLAELVARGWVQKQELHGQVYYCINGDKEAEIRAALPDLGKEL